MAAIHGHGLDLNASNYPNADLHGSPGTLDRAGRNDTSVTAAAASHISLALSSCHIGWNIDYLGGSWMRFHLSQLEIYR
jgi:hypothetical protein